MLGIPCRAVLEESDLRFRAAVPRAFTRGRQKSHIVPGVHCVREGRQRHDIIIQVVHLVGGEFLVFVSDDIIPALVNQKIALEGGFLVEGGHAGLETGVGRLDVPVSVSTATITLS